MAKFGNSQRLEISQDYLDSNTNSDRYNRFRAYATINPRENIAEDGQCVMLCNTEDGINVVPDAAGYQLNVDVEKLDEQDRYYLFWHELQKHKFGVNQGQKGVDQIHSNTGRGWDISTIKGHNVVITHTGHEPIYRNQLVAIRFPTKEDMEAQANTWASGRGNSKNVSKFATYPVDENMSIMLGENFHTNLTWQKLRAQRCFASSDCLDAVTEHIQLPALLTIIKDILNAADNRDMKPVVEQIKNSTTFSVEFVQHLLSIDGVEELLSELAYKSIDFVNSLRAPAIIAKCIGFKSIHQQDQRYASCGDILRCQIY